MIRARSLTVAAAAAVAMMSLSAAAADRPLRFAVPLFSPTVHNPYQGLSLPSSLAVISSFDPLVVVDGQGQIRPWLATAWSTKDSKVWSITLRGGVTFSNGAPLTAEAVVASAAYLKTPKGMTTTIGSNLANIARVEVTGPLAADIVLKQPDPIFAIKMMNWKIPEPKSWAASLNDEGDGFGKGSGPFMVVDDTPARILYVANPHAWNKPAAPRMELHLLGDQMTRMQALSSDAVDMAMQIGPGDREDVTRLGGQPLKRLSMRVRYVSFATEHRPASPITNQNVRLAMNYAVNRQRIVEAILGGTATMVGQLVLPGSPGYVPEIAPFPHDPAKAKALLAEAGYARGLKVTVRIGRAEPEEDTYYTLIAQDLRAVGIDFVIIPAAALEMTRMMFQGNFEADMFANFGRGLDGLGDYRYRSCLGQTGSNKPYFCDAESLQSVKLAQQSTDFAVVDQLMQNVTRREYENPPGIFLWQEAYTDAAGPNIEAAPDYDAYYDFLPLHLVRMKP
ncbi:MAG: ABC transporter substrate-binding protein [Rhodospirillaceae bacterium]|nr:ABC transporter substrate-binding protein [Rhodospirillaceae bacterium]